MDLNPTFQIKNHTLNPQNRNSSIEQHDVYSDDKKGHLNTVFFVEIPWINNDIIHETLKKILQAP